MRAPQNFIFKRHFNLEKAALASPKSVFYVISEQVQTSKNGLGYRCNSGDLTKTIRGSDRNLRSYLLKALTIYVGQVPEHSCGVRQPKRGDMKVAMGISPLRYLVAEFSNVLEFLDMGRVLWW